jgi:hypothetical protein
MSKLIEFVLGVLVGAFVGFLVFDGLFGEDPIQRENAKRSQKAHCEAYKEELLRPQSPQEFEHQAKLYSKLCKEE